MASAIGDSCETRLIGRCRRCEGLEAALTVVFVSAGGVPDTLLPSGEEAFGAAQVHGRAEQV